MLLIKYRLSEHLKMDVPVKALWHFFHSHWNMNEAVSLVEDKNI